jgi:Rhodopirellula transposase DDE domain
LLVWIHTDKLAIYTRKYTQLLPTLNERARRLVVAADAKTLGRGGLGLCQKASGLDHKTIQRGMRELDQGHSLPPERSRKPGGGRKKLTEKDPTLREDLEKLVAPDTRGDPESPLKWTVKSTRVLRDELLKEHHKISHVKVAELLAGAGYSLQAQRKTMEGADHADRDEQFRHINERAKEFLQAGDPVISVDTKKQELVGNFKNNGRQWLPEGEPIEVSVHDFPDQQLGKAVPYGILDLASNRGYVNVGINHDTGEFSVASIKRWWKTLGKKRYPHAKRLLVTADSGGSNGYRLRLWQKELQRFADSMGLEVSVCHYPPGTSKWNKIEHKLFSFISMNWRGKVLESYQVIVNLIAATKTRTGLTVYATLDNRIYALKKKVTDQEMQSLNLHPDPFHGEWNYTLQPRK